MNRTGNVAERKRQLLVRSDAERNDIARIFYKWQARAQVAKHATRIFKNPLVLAGLGLLLLKLPWKKAYKLGGWGWRGWKLLQLVRRIVR